MQVMNSYMYITPITMWKSEQIFFPKNMYNYGQVQLNQNMTTGDNWLIIIIILYFDSKMKTNLAIGENL